MSNMAREELERRRKNPRYAEAVRLLAERGVTLTVWGCGCCDSPYVELDIDGETYVDAGDAHFYMHALTRPLGEEDMP